MKRSHLVAVLFASLLPAAGLAATTPEPSQTAGWRGEPPKESPKVSLSASDEEVADILDELAQKAGWGLVVAAPGQATSSRMTLKVNDRPATEVVDLVARQAGLAAELQGSTLVIRSASEADAAKVKIGDMSFSVETKGEHGHRHKKGKGNDDRVQVGGSVEVKAGETVGDAVAVGGSVSVQGHVRGDAVAVGGSIVLGPGAEVDGDAVSIGGTIDVPEGAKLGGDRVSLGGSMGGILASIAGTAIGAKLIPWWLHGVGSTVLRAVVLFIVALLLLTFAPERLTRVGECATRRAGASALVGLALVVGVVPLCVLLAVTLIGIPLIPVAAFAVVACFLMGLASFATWLGDRLPILRGRKTPVGSMALGVLALLLVGVVPILGSIAIFGLGVVSSGAVLLSRFGTGRKSADFAPPPAA